MDGSHKAMTVAWEALQGDYRADKLTLQQRARVFMRRAPILD
ncbi:hypothetical protein [Pararhodobacter sp. SW119]|nr:hypothetical protein [Pararhodobacter sp. SW119]